MTHDFRMPPPTRTDDVVETIYGVEIRDPYRWLEDQDSPETRAWIDAQMAHTTSLLHPRPERERARRRLAELLKVDSLKWPTARHGTYFYSYRRADQNLATICRQIGLDGAEEVLIDPHAMSEDHSISVGIARVSDDGALLAYFIRHGGEDEIEMRIRDVARGVDLPDRIAKARLWSVSFAKDNSHFYYVAHRAEGPRVYRHNMGDPNESDRELFGDGYGPETLIDCGLSHNGKHLLITVYHGSAATKTEVYVMRAATAELAPIVNDIEARFEGEFADDTLFLRTNWDAPNGRIIAVDMANTSRENWREVIPESSAVIEGFSAAGGFLFVNLLENVKSAVKIYLPDGTPDGEVEFPTLGSVSGFGGRWDETETFFAFTSFTVPTSVYRFDAATREQTLWSRENSPVDCDAFETKQVWYKSKDGTKVPMFIVHRRGLERDGTAPTLLTGYGGFTASQTPVFNTQAVVWAEAGGVFALPNLRGGGEFGENWHRAGMLGNKQNVFDDFYAAAEWLIANGYSDPKRMAASGGSNGGLLVGAAMTQRPDLFRAIVCSYPLLDMIRYHRHLVAGFWVPEYGSSENAEQFEYLLRYSPYHNVRPGTEYPATLFVTGDFDTRVAPLHARKMVALVQAQTGSSEPILLHYNTKAGHSPGQPIDQLIDDASDRLAFLMWQSGM